MNRFIRVVSLALLVLALGTVTFAQLPTQLPPDFLQHAKILHATNVPAELCGRPVLSNSILSCGDSDTGERMADHLLSFGRHASVTKSALSYLELQTMADNDFPYGRHYYTKSGYFTTLQDTVVRMMVDSPGSIPLPNTQIELAYLGGAAGQVGAAETAFGDHSAPLILNLLAGWADPADDAANIAWVRGLFASLRPAMKPGVYVNFMSGDEQDRVQEAYSERWNKLQRVKEHYDPGNFFRLNQNIRPSIRPVSS